VIFRKKRSLTRSFHENEMFSVITPDVVYGRFNGLLRKGLLANEKDNCSLQKFFATLDHSIRSGVYTPAFHN
jgi:hypothetical protein